MKAPFLDKMNCFSDRKMAKKPCRNGPNCKNRQFCRFEHEPSQAQFDVQVDLYSQIVKLNYLLFFQCKFSNVPGGCKRPDCPYFHPGRSAQAGEGSRTFRDRLQRSRSRSSREDDRMSSPKDRLERGTKRNIEEVHEMHSAEGNKGR